MPQRSQAFLQNLLQVERWQSTVNQQTAVSKRNRQTVVSALQVRVIRQGRYAIPHDESGEPSGLRVDRDPLAKSSRCRLGREQNVAMLVQFAFGFVTTLITLTVGPNRWRFGIEPIRFEALMRTAE